jgi:hypothetical protein
MNAATEFTLKSLARKYIWWKSPDEALAMPQRIMASVMNTGDYEDIQLLANLVGEDVLRDTIAHAEAGQFEPRAWAYWHYRLGLAELEQVPDLPKRTFD